MNQLVDARAEVCRARLAGHRLASLFSSPPWIETLAQTYSMEICASLAHANGSKDGIVLFGRVSDLRGERVACLPFSDYCDPLVEDSTTWEKLIDPILALGVPVTLRCLRNPLPLGDARFEQTGQAMWHAVDLQPGEDELWAGLSGSARQNVRKAHRARLTVRAGRSLEDVAIFHRLHCHVRKFKYRLLAQPFAFFANLHANFAPEDRLTVLLAEADGEPVAGIFLLEWADTLYYKFNASLDQQLRPNDLLAWEAIRLGLRRNLARLDFGLSDIEQPGLIRYKRKFATEEGRISQLRWRPPAYHDPRAEEIARAFARMTQLFTDPTVSDDVTRAAGDNFYRYFC